jgi:ornithine carbamoyltransferase
VTRRFLDLAACRGEDLRAMLDAAAAMKAARAGRPKGTPDDDRPLAGRMLAMIFEKPSTRTRVSFDMAMRQLGGETMLLNGAEMQLGRGETMADTARVLSRYVDAIMIRTTAHEKLMELAEHADVPVINALTDASHPCQLMADVMTVEERLGPIAGRRVAWCGDGNNVACTYVEAARRFGFSLRLATPEALDVPERVLEAARAEDADVAVTRDPEAAAAGAEVVVTDTWLSMNDEGEARERRHNLLRPYQVDAALMRKAAPGAVFLHCLPAHRGEEATAEVMDGPQSAIFDEAENRLHAQKGVLRWCLGAL